MGLRGVAACLTGSRGSLGLRGPGGTIDIRKDASVRWKRSVPRGVEARTEMAWTRRIWMVVAASVVLAAACVLDFPPVTAPADAEGPSPPEGSVAPHCEGDCVPCTQQSTESDCAREQGCSWDSTAHCGGTCVACRSLSPQDCETQHGCGLEELGFCMGTCLACSDITDEETCSGQLGCDWVANPCSGQPTPCEELAGGDCTDQPGCSWGGGTCDGTDFGCMAITSMSLCNQLGCFWAGALCTGTGTEGPFHCSSLSKVHCGEAATCEWSGGSGCTGQAVPCEDRASQDTCVLGCTWGHRCDGSCVPCSNLTDATLCSSQVGCQWQARQLCAGNCVACSALGSSEECQSQRGCTWSTTGGCSGTCAPCTSFDDPDSCTSQPGCRWVE